MKLRLIKTIGPGESVHDLDESEIDELEPVVRKLLRDVAQDGLPRHLGEWRAHEVKS